jgi:hypothetical protein
MEIKELQALKAKLPRGWSVKAAKELGCSQTMLSRMMLGTLPVNMVFLDHLVTMAEKHTQLSKSLSERIHKLKN